MNTSSQLRKRLSISAAVASLLLSRSGAANLDNATVQFAGSANNNGLFGQLLQAGQPWVIGAEPSLSTTNPASPNFTAAGFPILQEGLNQATPSSSSYSNVDFNNSNFGSGYPFVGP